MNTKQLLLTMAIIAAIPVSIAMAESTTPATTQDGSGQQEQKFEEYKAKALQMLDKHAVKILEKRACVQAATDGKALKACFPNRGKHGGRDNRGDRGNHVGED